MPFLRIGTGCALPLLIGALFCAGCSTTSQQANVSVREPRPQIQPPQDRVRDVLNGRPLKAARLQSSEITAVNHEEPDDNESFAPSADEEPFAGASELVLPTLVSEVQRRNPTLQASIAAWAAASERYPQAVALEDPLLQSMFAPGSFASNSSTQASYFIGVAQKVSILQNVDHAHDIRHHAVCAHFPRLQSCRTMVRGLKAHVSVAAGPA